MSFSSGVKEELYRHISPARHCQLAELAALLHFNGSIGVGTTGTFLQIHAENALVVRKCFTLLEFSSPRKPSNILVTGSEIAFAQL